VELRVDGVPAPLSLIESKFPTLEAMREGLGTIRVKLRAARSGHELRFENRHLPQISAYLVNCLAAPSDGLVVGRQERDFAHQREVHAHVQVGRPAQGSHGIVEGSAVGTERGAGDDALEVAAEDARVDAGVEAEVVAAHDEPPHARSAS
jgi:hypothetical protein